MLDQGIKEQQKFPRAEAQNHGKIGNNYPYSKMTATLEIPDVLYSKLAARSAQLGVDVSSLTLGYYRKLVNDASVETESAESQTSTQPTSQIVWRLSIHGSRCAMPPWLKLPMVLQPESCWKMIAIVWNHNAGYD